MRHLRADYEAIQPWPTKRPHWARSPFYPEGPRLFDNAREVDSGLEPVIPDDEPVFVLRCKDRTGPEVVRFWADVNERDGGDPMVMAAVRQWADKMEGYAREHYDGGKLADTPWELLQS